MSRRFTIFAALTALMVWLGACEDRSAEEFIQRAEDYRQNGDLPASIIELKNALQKDPQHARARFLLGQAYYVSRNLSGAEKEFLRARDHGFPLERLVGPLSQLWLDQGRYQEVLNAFRLDAASTPAQRTALLLARGRAHQASGSLQAAERDFESVLAQDPGNVDALVGLARVAMGLNDDSKAQRAAARAFEIAPGNLNVLAVEADLAFRGADYGSAKANYESILRARPGSIAVRLALARTELALGDLERCKEQLDLLLARARAHPDANYLRASLAIEERDFEAAARHAELVLTTKPDHGPGLLIAGVANYVLGRLEQADRHLRRLLAGDPSNRLARQVQAAARLRLERFQGAGNTASRLLDDTLAPRQLLDFVDLALWREHDLAAAQAFFESATAEQKSLVLDWPPARFAQDERYERERSRLRAALTASPEDVSLLSELGRVEARSGNLAAATARFRSAIAADPYALAPRLLLAQLHLRLGRATDALEVSRVALREHSKLPILLGLIGLSHLHNGETQAAKLALRDLVDVRPESPQAHYLLSLVYRAEGDGALYRERLEKVLELDEGHVWARLARARLSAQAGNLEPAARSAARLVQDAAEVPDVLDLAGILALLQGDADLAVARFQKAAAGDPRTSRMLKLAYAQQRAGDAEGSRATLENWLQEFPRDPNARLVLANKYLNSGKLQQARAHYAQIVLFAPDNVVVLNNLAWIALELDDLEAALDYGERAYLSAPEDARVLDTYGMAMLRAGKTEEAVAMLRRAQKTSPEVRAIHVNLARALRRQGQTAEARRILEDLLSQDADFPERREAEALMRELGT